MQNVEQHFKKEIEILKKNQSEILVIKDSINKKNSLESIRHIFNYVEDKFSCLMGMMHAHEYSTKKNRKDHDQNIQEIWNISNQIQEMLQSKRYVRYKLRAQLQFSVT